MRRLVRRFVGGGRYALSLPMDMYAPLTMCKDTIFSANFDGREVASYLAKVSHVKL